MDLQKLINERVHHYYWDEDFNCATTTLKILSEIFRIELSPQTIDAAIGMHGAGAYGAQCGLVEGALMFLGIYGRVKGAADDVIISHCYHLAQEFENHFSSLICRILRPQGFRPENPPHLCEEITKKAILFTVDYLTNL